MKYIFLELTKSLKTIVKQFISEVIYYLSLLEVDLFSFIPSLLIKRHQIKQFPHSAPHPVAIVFFKFISTKIGGGVGFDFPFGVQKKFISGQ